MDHEALKQVAQHQYKTITEMTEEFIKHIKACEIVRKANSVEIPFTSGKKGIKLAVRTHEPQYRYELWILTDGDLIEIPIDAKTKLGQSRTKLSAEDAMGKYDLLECCEALWKNTIKGDKIADENFDRYKNSDLMKNLKQAGII